MSTKYNNDENCIRCYEISDPTLHPKGYTIYKITQRVRNL